MTNSDIEQDSKTPYPSRSLRVVHILLISSATAFAFGFAALKFFREGATPAPPRGGTAEATFAAPPGSRPLPVPRPRVAPPLPILRVPIPEAYMPTPSRQLHSHE